ncbi:MAG: hypothetical protein AAF412_14655, partial [Pseudomonadota bacterium]
MTRSAPLPVMINLSLAIIAVFASHGVATADDCLSRFKTILTDFSDKGPIRITTDQEIVGNVNTKNYF